MDELKNNIKRQFETEFNLGGYVINNTHFKSGSSFHSSRYFFVKRFLQNNSNCFRLAKLLKKKLEEIRIVNNTTLIGFGEFTSFLLSTTLKGETQINYAIIERKDESYYWQKRVEFKDNLLIVLPLTYTCSTFIKLNKFILNELKQRKESESKVSTDFIILFSALAIELKEKHEESLNFNVKNLDKTVEYIESLYRPFGWTGILEDTISLRINNVDYTGHSLISLYSKLYVPEKCNICFPSNGEKYEKPLFPTYSNLESPSVIFRTNNFNENYSNLKIDSFIDPESDHNIHLFGHIQVNKSSYLNFIRGNAFYTKNKMEILEYMEPRIIKVIGNNTDRVIFISAQSDFYSSFLEDLSQLESMQSKDIYLLRYEPESEFIENFISLHEHLFILEKTKILYFEDVLSAGKTFKLLSDYIKHARRSNPPFLDEAFSAIITLVDRTTLYTKFELRKKIGAQQNENLTFISYLVLNAPIISAAHLGNPLKKRGNELLKITEYCHIDALKVMFGKEIVKHYPKQLHDVEYTDKFSESIDFFPFSRLEISIDEDIFLLYKNYLSMDKYNLFKLFLIHEINGALSHLLSHDNIEEVERNLASPSEIVKEIILHCTPKVKGIFEKLFITDIKSSKRNLRAENDAIHDLIIKILSRHPYIYYRKIYEGIFEYCLLKLDSLHEIIEKGGVKSFQVFRTLKFYIKRSVELNSNFILSKRFFKYIKLQYDHAKIEEIRNGYRSHLNELRSRPEYLSNTPLSNCIEASLRNKLIQVDSYFSFLQVCFKELVHKNPFGSIVLEEILNSRKLLPEFFDDPKLIDQIVDEKIFSPYFQFTGILKSENIHFIDDLKEFHKRNIHSQLSKGSSYGRVYRIIKLRQQYFYYKKNDPVILNARNFLNHSRHKKDDSKFFDIINSVCKMLRTVSLLELNGKGYPFVSRKTQSPLNDLIEKILVSLIDIIKVESGEGQEYSFFVEYRKKEVGDSSTDNIYSFNERQFNDPMEYERVHSNGIVNSMLYGLTDCTELGNEQTVICAAKNKNGNFISFNNSFRLKNCPNSEIDLDTLINNDKYDIRTGIGLKSLLSAQMVLVFRFAKFNVPPNKINEQQLEGQAVLVVTSNKLATLRNYLDFFSNEKIRLILLIKDELLQFLQNQFDNDAFIDLIDSRKASNFQTSLRHGLSTYTDAIEYLFAEDTSFQPDSDIFKVFYIAIKAIKGQIADEHLNNDHKGMKQEYTLEEILNHFKLIFETTKLGSYKIIFFHEMCIGFDFEKILLHKVVLDVIFPEIIINVKKYSPRYGERDIKIKYVKEEKTFIFSNLIAPNFFKKGQSEYSGLSMATKLLRRLSIGELHKQITDNNFSVHLKLTADD